MKNTTKKGIVKESNIHANLHPDQVDLARLVAKEAVRCGFDVFIRYDNCTIDIETIIDSQVSNGLNISRFRVFWHPKNDFYIQYLGFGAGYYDGYEITRGWTHTLQLSDISKTLKQDILYYYSL